MKNGLSTQIKKVETASTHMTSFQDMSRLGSGLQEMGRKLLELSSGIETMTSYSDIMEPGLPKREATLNNLLYDENKNLREVFDEVVVDEQYSLMIIKLKGHATEGQKQELVTSIKDQLKEGPLLGVESIITGKPVLDGSIRSTMQESMQHMVALAVILMTLVLFIVFKVRWRLLAIPIIFLSVVATIGLMGFVGVPMTMVSMAVFPILIGLGVDYAIQFHNRYEEEIYKEDI